MTTFHEPPAQSRRAARRSERGESAEFSGRPGVYNPEQPASATQSAPRDNTVPRAAYSESGFPSSTPAADPRTTPRSPQDGSGRRSRVRSESQGLYDVPAVPPTTAATPAANGEPLTYLTPDSQLFSGPDSARVAQPTTRHENRTQSLADRLSPNSAPQAPAQPAYETPAYRVHDFSPEGGRRAARAAETAAAHVPLSYQTQQPPLRVPEETLPARSANLGNQATLPDQQEQFAPQLATAPPAPRAQSAPAVSPPPPEQTLTRRELRALQAEQDAAAGIQLPAEVPPLVEPLTPSNGSTASALSNAIAEFEALAREAQSKTAATPPTPPLSQPPAPAPPPAAAFVGLAPPAPDSAVQPDFASSSTEPPAQWAPVPSAPPVQQAPPFTQAPPRQPAPPANDDRTLRFSEPVVDAGVVVEPSYASTAGHWSRQAALDDETQPFENTLSREVGRGHVSTATNALVLPTAAHINDIATAINSTGEILVTGSITLPSSLGSKGGDSRRYDDPDVDALFDAYDNEIVATDSAPVSAIRAVSTHTSTHGVISANKPTGNRLMMGMMIFAGVLGVAVFVLLIAGFVLKIF
jgi:hypothetical protein